MTIWTAGACCAGVAAFPLEPISSRGAALLASVLAAGAAAGLAHWRQGPATLKFDGQNWSLAGTEPVHAARLMPQLDLQWLLLVHIAVAGQRSRWLWLERRSAPEQWIDLRRAVYSRAPPAGPADPIAASQRSAGDSPFSS